MDNNELSSKIWGLDTKLFSLELSVGERIWRIWLVMFLGFYTFALFGLSLIHGAYEDAVHEMRHEMRHELAALQSKAPPQATPLRPTP